ncbi:MAG: hypothetical protein MZV64_48565 [Ignavibacteriales bacterium]|nr:hypothetical protein [Ignavibacteriales bacterium]
MRSRVFSSNWATVPVAPCSATWNGWKRRSGQAATCTPSQEHASREVKGGAVERPLFTRVATAASVRVSRRRGGVHVVPRAGVLRPGADPRHGADRQRGGVQRGDQIDGVVRATKPDRREQMEVSLGDSDDRPARIDVPYGSSDFVAGPPFRVLTSAARADVSSNHTKSSACAVEWSAASAANGCGSRAAAALPMGRVAISASCFDELTASHGSFGRSTPHSGDTATRQAPLRSAQLR